MGTVNPNFTQSYQPMLQESTQHFLTQLNSGVTDFSHFNLMFSRLIQTMNSPPLEIIWFYTAVNYHTHKNLTKVHYQQYGKFSCVKELFDSLISCSGMGRSSVNRIAVLAPLVYELHSLVIESDLVNGLRLGNVVGREISFLVDRLVSYISLCCCEGVNDHDVSLAFSACFVDLVKVWTVERRGKCCEFEEDFRMFFPLISDESRNEVWLIGEVGVLAGFVMCQVFLLNLCLKFGVEKRTQNFEEYVMKSAVDKITGFRSCYFFDALLRMLLESSLPVTSLLTATDEVVLHHALLDAIVLVDYPFFNPASGICLCNQHLNGLASTWLFVADRALQLARNDDNQTKVISYKKAFNKSLLHSQLMKWVSNQICMVEEAPKFSTPTTFLEWLMQLKGVYSGTFDNEFSLLLDKATHYNNSKITTNLPISDNEDLEMIDSGDGVKSDISATEASRKRKGVNDGDSVRLKLLKYHIEGRPLNDFLPFQAEVGLSRRS